MYSDLKECCVAVDATLMDAIRVIDQAGAGIALVVDQDQRLCGTLTDGDIRRAIIKGANLDAKLRPHIITNYLSVSESEGRAEVLDLMQAHLIDQVPVVDDNKRLLGLHLIHGILGAEQRPNWAVIMAGGKGTRLYPLTKDIPKPMVKVAGRPILERLILHLVSHGIHRIFLSVNYLSEVITDHFGNGERFGCQIEYIHEDEPLGTAGSLSLLPEEPADPILVMNGDLVMSADLGAMLAYHERGDYHATIGVKTYSHQVPYGCVTVDGDCITKIEEKPDIIQQVNAGVYVLSPDAVGNIPRKFYLITEMFSSALEQGRRVGAFDLDCDWVDVGQHDQLKHARGEA
jgi:dTDP-glucose pyrophosphorylase